MGFDMKTFWSILPTLISLAVLAIGYIFASGRLKEKITNMVTKEELLAHCKFNQDQCINKVGNKIDDLKDLVIDLHDKQSKKIESMDDKREKAKEKYNTDLTKLSKAMGRIEGHIEILRNGTN